MKKCKKCGGMPEKVIEVCNGAPMVFYRCKCGRSSNAFRMMPKAGSYEIPERSHRVWIDADKRARISWILNNH